MCKNAGRCIIGTERRGDARKAPDFQSAYRGFESNMPDQDLEVMCHIAAHLKIDGPDQVASWEPDWHVNASGNLVVEWPNGRPEIVPDGPTILPPLNDDEEEYEDDSL